MGKKNVTFDDIAKYTNFSKTTISRYFNNPDSLTLENQQIIAEALTALNYHENKVARILANGKTEFVGIIVPNLDLHYYSAMLSNILTTYETYGYKFLVFIGNEQKDIELQYINELMAYKIEGLIVLSHSVSSKELSSFNIPVVTIEREDEFVSSVNTDNYMGAVQATSLLIKDNCDVLIHINSDTPKNIPTYKRITGFEDTCRQHNVPYEIFIADIDNQFEKTRNIIADIVDKVDVKYAGKKKGIFMANDTFANTLLNVIIQKHGSFPDDYSIVGFDGSPISQEAIIPISTVAQQIDVLAKEAMEMLVAQMNERKKRRPVPLETPIHKIVTPVLIRRGTTS